MWILHNLYAGLDQPTRQPRNRNRLRNHVARLERWVAAHPNSITGAGGACAVLRGYGWVATRGETSDTVSDSG